MNQITEEKELKQEAIQASGSRQTSICKTSHRLKINLTKTTEVPKIRQKKRAFGS
jgi:hypothetical protein